MNPFPPALQPALAAFEAGQFETAEQLCRAQLEQAPCGELFFLLGLIANKSARHAESVQWLERAAQILPPSVRLLSALGGAYRASGAARRAAECYTRCLQLDPQCAEARHQLADACYEVREFELAAQLYRSAAASDPGNVSIWNNLGNTLRSLSAPEDAVAAYDRALALRPDDPVIHANRGRSLLLAGRLDEGFREFEFRWKPLGLRTYPQPVWRGETMRDKTLFVFAEQGLGDTIQFVRYLFPARDRVGRIILECQPQLKTLLENSRCADAIIATGETAPSCDVYVPLLHLPSIFRTTLETVPAHVPYLTPATRSLPETPADHLKVGIAWAGNPRFLDDAVRSVALEKLAPLFEIRRISFFNLQFQIPARDEACLRSAPLVNAMNSVTSFADTAAMIAGLDLVISVDTAVAHLAGALGKPVWTILGLPSDWRWMMHRADSPWYPTMRLFRQTKAGNWEMVLAQVAAELCCLADGKSEEV